MQDIATIVFGMAGLLALVSLVLPLSAQLNLPFTVLLAVVGGALGVLVRFSSFVDGLGMLGDFVRALGEINLSAEAFLVIFLPLLVFEAALAVDVRRLLDDIVPVLALAVVAVLVSTFMVGVAVWPISGVRLVGCLLLGAILATTDPTAVIGIFRDLGAPRRVTTLIAGESLLNDAAAIVLYTLLLDILTGRREPVASDAVVAFLYTFGGGLLLGAGLGQVLCWLVAPLRSVALSEISLTIAFAWLAYIIGEYHAHVSGVVAVVTTALVVASVGRTHFSPETWHELETVWRQVGFWASSIIFLLAAMIVPANLLKVSFKESMLLLVVAVAALAARALVLFGLMPLLSALGLARKLTIPHSTVILWGGLRGAVSLTLALGVTQNLEVEPYIQHFIAVLAPGYVLTTLLINGITLRPLIRLLGLDKLSAGERAMSNRALALTLSAIADKVEAVARDYRIGPEVTRRTVEQYIERLAAIELTQAAEPPLCEADQLYIGLVILVNREEELYLHYFKEGIISRAIVELLLDRTAWLMDGARAGGLEGYQAAARRTLAYSRHLIWAQRALNRFRLRGPLARRLSIRFEALIINRAVMRDLAELNRRKLAPLLGAAAAQKLGQVIELRRDLVEQALSALRMRYADYAPVVEFQYLSRAALRMEEANYDLMHAESLISQEILNELKRDLERRWKAVEQPPRLDLGLQLPDLIGRVPVFSGLNEAGLAQIARMLRARLGLPGEVLVRRGDRGDSMFFIASGTVEVLIPDQPGRSDPSAPIRLGAGDFFGELALLNRAPRSADVRSVGYCHLLELHATDFRRLMDQDADIREHILAVAERRRSALSPAG